MITAFLSNAELHAVHEIHQKGMTKIRAIGMCKAEDDAGTGIYQVAPWVFDGRPTYGEIPVCVKCTRSVIAMREPPR